MKIVFVVPEISKTGGMRIIFEYANRLQSNGHDVTVVSSIVPFNPYKGEFKWFYFKYRIRYALDFLKNKIEKPENLFKVNFKIKYIPYPSKIFLPQADIYIATSWTSSFLVDKLSSKSKKFYLVQDYEIWNSNKKLVDESYTLPLKKIVVSTYLKNLLKNKFNEDSDVVLNGIDFTKFDNPQKNSFSVKTILLMDHSLENKNVKDALKIVNRVHKKFPEIKFICFGKSKYSQIPEFVKFYENPSDEVIASLYKQSDIFLFTSLQEGFGLPPAEAMACKCAVVGYNTAALPDFSINGESAMLCEAGDVDALYNDVNLLIKDDNLLRRISMNGYEHVKKILDWKKSYSEFEKIILS